MNYRYITKKNHREIGLFKKKNTIRDQAIANHRTGAAMDFCCTSDAYRLY